MDSNVYIEMKYKICFIPYVEKLYVYCTFLPYSYDCRSHGLKSFPQQHMISL